MCSFLPKPNNWRNRNYTDYTAVLALLFRARRMFADEPRKDPLRFPLAPIVEVEDDRCFFTPPLPALLDTPPLFDLFDTRPELLAETRDCAELYRVLLGRAGAFGLSLGCTPSACHCARFRSVSCIFTSCSRWWVYSSFLM